jgi:hypothetical protein
VKSEQTRTEQIIGEVEERRGEERRGGEEGRVGEEGRGEEDNASHLTICEPDCEISGHAAV